MKLPNLDPMTEPTVTILIATYNRAALLPRAVSSVLNQSFKDFEIVIIDDCSTDDTPRVASTFSDPRIRYIRNEVNQGSKLGDRAHVRRTVHELMRGQYFVYLCDDDYWLPEDLLARQMEAFGKYPSLAIAIGGHAHTHDRDVSLHNTTLSAVPGAPPFTYRAYNALPSGFMTSEQYLNLYAAEPIFLNFLDGATLFKREAFLKANAFGSPDGSRWQAGYEFKVGPALIGDVFFIDEACVIAGVEAGNASYRGTQFEHYLDCLKSIELAYDHAWPAVPEDKRQEAFRIKRRFIKNITSRYLCNRLNWNLGRFDTNPVDHTPMFRDNLTPSRVAKVYWKHRIIPDLWQSKAILASAYGDDTRHSKLMSRWADKLISQYTPA